MSGHTPGPWAVSPDHIFRNQADIFEIHWSTIGECITECVHGEANARLIAAAPELLAVVKELDESADYWGEFDVPLGIVDRLRSAIAKATGEGA